MPVRFEMRGVSMASSRVLSGNSRLAAVAVAFGMAVGVAVAGAGFLNPDRLLERSYARSAPLGNILLDEVVSDGDRQVPVTKAAVRVTPPPALLIDGVAVQSGVLNEPLAIGARVRLAPGSVGSRDVEVIDAAEMDAPVVGLPGVRLQLVTARLVGALDAEPVRLIFTVRDAGHDKVTPASADRVAGKVL